MEKISRREALMRLGIVAGGVAVLTAPNTAPNRRVWAAGYKDSANKFDRPLTAITLGAGSRGTTYGEYATEFPKELDIVGVAEPIVERNDLHAKVHDIPDENRFVTWEHVLERPKFADMVIIAMPDHLHYEPCIQAMRLGYDVLLEKPMAQSEEQCREILEVQQETGRVVGIAHVLRYAPYFIDMRKIVLSGKLGRIVNMQHMEPIEWRHMMHSYVRGNWHNSVETTPIILAKSCHDLDIMRWIMDEPCDKITGFGRLSFFKRGNAPKGSGDRCLDCAVEEGCAYSAKQMYLRRHLAGRPGSFKDLGEPGSAGETGEGHSPFAQNHELRPLRVQDGERPARASGLCDGIPQRCHRHVQHGRFHDLPRTTHPTHGYQG
jgi:predicted dehydrogenase